MMNSKELRKGVRLEKRTWQEQNGCQAFKAQIAFLETHVFCKHGLAFKLEPGVKGVIQGFLAIRGWDPARHPVGPQLKP